MRWTDYSSPKKALHMRMPGFVSYDNFLYFTATMTADDRPTMILFEYEKRLILRMSALHYFNRTKYRRKTNFDW